MPRLCTVVAFLQLILSVVVNAQSQAQTSSVALPRLLSALELELTTKYGQNQQGRIHRGVRQVSEFWRSEDGDSTVLADFVRSQFIGDRAVLDTMFNRLESSFEQLNGHMAEIGRVFRTQTDLDLGPVQPFDEIFAGYDPSAHLIDDFFANKLAFSVLLNFPLTTLEERLHDGPKWTRRQWAEARLTRMFSHRVPADVNLAIARAVSEADQYIADYNIWMHHLLTNDGKRPFPAGLRLLSHWNLRDEIKAEYSEGKTALPKQRLIQQVMERIVTQTIPESAINNPGVDWNPVTNSVVASTVQDGKPKSTLGRTTLNAPEPDTRYSVLLKTFQASHLADPFCPTAPTLIARRFDEDRELPEARVKAMLEQVAGAPEVTMVAALIRQRLGRPLEPFDIWYNGFRPRGAYTEEQLDKIVRAKYPTADAYKKDIPNLLVKLGFTKERAQFYADHIEVDPARGSGHAMGAAMRSANSHLRTRVEAAGMNYKGFNIAIHEMGHNVEQVTSLNLIDHTLLAGVPNTAFTEALAFVFQGHDLALLGLETSDPKREALKALDDFWGAYEISGVALLDMAVWHWMYDNPNATPASLKEATLRMAKEIWNKYYAPVFETRDVVLLAIYSHMIHSLLYLPDYPLGHLIAHQIEEHVRAAGPLGPEFERMAREGCVAPDVWMNNATGAPVGAESLLSGARHALNELGGVPGGKR
jgi:hypothetical protein